MVARFYFEWDVMISGFRVERFGIRRVVVIDGF